MSAAAHWLMVLLAALVGGAVGSFLNVVVYRVPLGLSLIAPPSHCPQCKTPIRWFDNVPVFGWIMLGGRCRHCRCQIPIRYPAIEVLSAAMFAAVAVVEWPLQAAYPYHLTLLGTLLSAALIELDGHRPPARLFGPALAVGIVTPLLWPVEQSVAWFGESSITAPGVGDMVVNLLAGVAAAGACWLLWRVGRKWQWREFAENATPTAGLLMGMICTGEYLGLPAVCAVLVGVVATHVLLGFALCRWAKIRPSPGALLWLFAFAGVVAVARLAARPMG